MTALVGVFGPAAETSAAAMRDMLGAMRSRASGTPESFSAPEARLLAARHDWEATLSGWSGPLMAADDHWVVAADATLYYLDDLRRRLRAAPKNAPTADLLLHALRQWGPWFARHLEGDYAIIALERGRGRVLLARDFGGRRTLTYATARGSLVVASSPTAVVRHPDVSSDYDLGFLAASAGGIYSPGNRTVFPSVTPVPGGSTLSIEDGRVTEIDRWTPPQLRLGWESQPSSDAAERLRHLLIEATRERLAAEGATTVWMSGGWDSTSIFASACASLGDARTDRPVLPISMTYNADDIGNEEGHIRSVAERWKAPVRWVNSENIPVFADTPRRTAKRDDPMAHPFESQMRELSQCTIELGSHIALDGFGGDLLFFFSSASIIADHLRYGRWTHLWQEWRNWHGSAREFARITVLPHLSPSVLDWIGTVRGRELSGFWDRGFPNWIISSPELAAELQPEFEQRPDEGATEFEFRKVLCTSVNTRVVPWNVAFGLDEGVQLRAPLFDQRLLVFAASLPASDRGVAGDGKRILRQAMANLLPDSVLAPRSRKTGTPAGYFRRQFQAVAKSEMAHVFQGGQSHLERLGLLDKAALLAALDQYAERGAHLLGSALHTTLEVERWLAVRHSGD